MLKIFILLIFIFINGCSGTEKKKTVYYKFPFKVERAKRYGNKILSTALWSGESPFLALANDKREISIFSLPDLKIKTKIKTGLSAVVSMAVIRKGLEIAAVSYTGKVRFFEINDGKEILYPNLKLPRRILSVISDEANIYTIFNTGKGDLLFLNEDMKTAFIKKSGFKNVRYLSFNNKGKKIIYSGTKRNFLIFDIGTLKLTKIINTTAPVISFAFRDSYFAVGTLFWETVLYNLKTLKKITKYNLDFNPVKTMVFHPFKNWLFIGSGRVGKGRIHVFRIPDMQKLQTIKPGTDEIIKLYFFKGKLVSIASKGRIIIYKSIPKEIKKKDD